MFSKGDLARVYIHSGWWLGFPTRLIRDRATVHLDEYELVTVVDVDTDDDRVVVLSRFGIVYQNPVLLLELYNAK